MRRPVIVWVDDDTTSLEVREEGAGKRTGEVRDVPAPRIDQLTLAIEILTDFAWPSDSGNSKPNPTIGVIKAVQILRAAFRLDEGNE